MNKKLATIAIITMILMVTLPQTRAGISNVTSNTTQTQNSPLQKISPYVQDEIKRNSTSSNQLIRILIKYNPNKELALPKGMMILRKFNILPLISTLASPFEIEELAKLEEVEYIYPDLKVQASSIDPKQWIYPDYPKSNNFQITQFAEPIPNTPWFGNYPCFLNESTTLIKARDLWAQGFTGKGVIIAILDTGINKNHPDLDDLDDDPTTCDPKVLAEQTFIEEPLWEVGDPMDYAGHGTHCASIAAGTGATGGMYFLGTYFEYNLFNATILPGTERGVAPGAYLYNVKVLNNQGYGYDSWIIAGIEWAMEKGADVISMSLGGWPMVTPEEDPLVLALNKAIEHGVVCAVAAGNAGWGYFSAESPGIGPAVITVGATTETDELATFSGRGPEPYELHAKPDIVAPGTCIVAALNNFDYYENNYGYQIFYWELSGTSMATPHVAGAAALLLQAFPGASPYTIKSAMMLGADDLGLDPMAQGAGRLNVMKAYEIMKNAAKKNWSAPIPTNTVTPIQPMPTLAPNLTGINILVDDSFCNDWKMSAFFSALSMLGANLSPGYAPYTNDDLVDPDSGQPYYDVFILSEPYSVDETALPPSVLAYYVQQNGTVLFTGDQPIVCTDYSVWTKQWGILWNNTAVGGHSTKIASHPITTGIHDIYFSSPIDSLILDTSVTPSPDCVVWDPILPGVAVWEAQAPSTGKVVVLSDDGILMDQYLFTADNFEFGSNIIKWLTNTPTIIAYAESPLIPQVESPHPYPVSADLWYLVSVPSASWISVHFQKIDVESGFDSVRIYDQFMNPIQYFSGYYEDVLTYPVLGNMLWINLQSDSSVQYWGFLADSVMYGINAPSLYHEIGVGGTWEKYVIANSTFTMTVDVQNFGNYTEDVGLYMTLYNSTGYPVIADWNFENVTVASGEKASVPVTPDVVLNATTICNLAGTQKYDFVISGRIYSSSSGSPPYSELDYTNNMFTGEIAAVPKTARSGPNPLLSVMTPMKIESDSVPLIAMYPNDFTLHNITAFVGGGDLTNAEFRISGTVTAIASFVDVKTFTKHYWANFGEWLPDPSPAYFTPNTTATIGTTLEIGDVSAPTMLSAELQIYISSNTIPGTYTGTVQLVNGTDVIASTSLNFEVRIPKSKVLWEDYFNDYWGYSSYGPEWGTDCERLWGGAWNRYVGGCVGLFAWWKLVANAGFDVDSLHQQLHFNEHAGFFGVDTKDPMQIIAYGGYNTMYMHDVDYPFSYQEISVFERLYETGKMNFVVLYNRGSEAIDMFTTNYGISYLESYMGMSSSPSLIMDMLVTGIDKTHPIFKDVENFTLSLYPYEGGYLLKVGPFIYGDGLLRYEGKATGIATGTDDFGIFDTSGFVVAVNELQATPHVTSRMVAVSDSNMFESLEYEDYLIWINLFMIAGNNTIVSRVDTGKFAVNILEWLTPQFGNTAPKIDYAAVTPDALKLGQTASVDLIASDAENDDFTVTIAVKNPDNTWNNATVSPVDGHWFREFTASQVGTHRVYAVVTDTYGASTMMPIGTVAVINNPPSISSTSISPNTVIQGDKVFVTVGAEDLEDGTPTQINITIASSTGGSIYNGTFTNTRFANVVFDTTSIAQGVYSIYVTASDSNGAKTTANIGSFEIILAPMAFPVQEIGLGVGIMALIALIAIAMLLWRRPSGVTPTPAPTGA